MLVIINVSGSKEVGVLAGIAIGATLGSKQCLQVRFQASMNPVRSLAQVYYQAIFHSLYLYTCTNSRSNIGIDMRAMNAGTMTISD
ncbi:MAG: hypothetical protein U0X76_06135 [Bacteroidia bacterium]